jgi:phage baseplate assembly protein W
MRYLPFYGKGISFPIRVDPVSGRFSVSVGSTDSASVALAYINEEAWTIREDVRPQQNLVAEAVSNILLTRQGEHDTLPEYGSDASAFIFDSISPETKYIMDIYFRQATVRWEKRAKIPQGSVSFPDRQLRAQYGELPVQVEIAFADKQPKGNLVAPYVSVSEARSAEYQSSSFDVSSHDYQSRYYDAPVSTDSGTIFNRLPAKRYIPSASDDYYYRVKYMDSWLSISHSEYGDIRYWNIIADMYVQDSAEEGLTSDVMYPSYQVEMGTQIRLASLTRVMTQMSVYQFTG